MEETLELEALAGNHISFVCAKAATLAWTSGKSVHFEFNDTHVIAQPGESAETLETRWNADMSAAYEAYINSDEYKQRQADREAKEKAEREAHMTEPATTEVELREAKVPRPRTKEQLTEYIESLVNIQHDYGTCVYAMSMAAEAAFNYVAHQVGASGFQSSCADMDFIRRTRHMDGPFMLIDGANALYPQYDLQERLAKAMEDWKPWLKEEAIKKIAEQSTVHPHVLEHWKKLAEMEVPAVMV